VKKKIIFSLLVLFALLPGTLHSAANGIIRNNHLNIFFEDPLRGRAEDIVEIYPDIREELEDTIGWKIDFIPTVLLFKNSESFRQMAGTDFVAAFAVPEKLLIVIDFSRMSQDPFKYEVILKHELCHLLLHYNIEEGRLPRWLDEGVAQWVSDGMAEVIRSSKHSILNRVVLSNRYIDLRDLRDGFPGGRETMTLAYEESKSLVDYINSEYGVENTLMILQHLKDGDGIERAIEKSLSLTLYGLEEQWHLYLKKRINWFTYVSYNMYEILFALTALLAIYGFVRLIRKKRAYRDEDDL